MFGRKPQKPSSGKRSANPAQLGIFNIPSVDDEEPMDLSDDDIDLEAELAAISGEPKAHRPRKPAAVPSGNLDAMVAESLKDVPSEDEDVSGDEDDPDLLSELKELGIDDASPEEAPPPPPRASRPAPAPPSLSTDSSTVSLLQDRIINYTAAEKLAKESGETSRARRFARGLKTLNDLLKQAKRGSQINDMDIPPPVPIKSAQPDKPSTEEVTPREPLDPEPQPLAPEAEVTEPEPPISPEPTEPPPPPPRVESQGLDPEKQQGLQIILKRKAEFKAAALASKHAGDKALALEYLKVVKQFDMVADAFKNGQEMDLNELPTPDAIAVAFRSQKTEDQTQNASGQLWQVSKVNYGKNTQAITYFKHAGDKALALEYLKVVKQFDMVADAFKNGQEMDLNELPTPDAIALAFRSQKTEDQTQNASEPAPPPTPAPDEGLKTAATLGEALKQRLEAFQELESKAKEAGNASKARRMGRIVKQYQDAIKAHANGKPIVADDLPTPAGYAPLPTDSAPPSSAPSRPAPSPRPAPRPATTPGAATRHEKQLAFLLLKQKEFKVAALKAKNDGDIEKAKEYLRAAKGFDAVIESARGGLLVDLKSLPLPPKAKMQIEQTFDIVTVEDCNPPDDASVASINSLCDEDALTKLHQQLASQLKTCQTNRDHYRDVGNIAEMNRFEHLAVSVKQDLDVVSVAKSLNQPPPKFHYESKQFSIVQVNTDLNENDLELTIVRGIAYNVANPKDVDTYVKFEFPYPQDTPVWDRTSLIKDSNSPVYNAVFPLAINRGARACQRVFKRHAIKFEVYSRGGWFSRDSLLGSAAVKLAPLETQVTVHEAIPLMDGRRPAGGSLEVKLRVRTPILTQHIEHTTHRWLVIDN